MRSLLVLGFSILTASQLSAEAPPPVKLLRSSAPKLPGQMSTSSPEASRMVRVNLPGGSEVKLASPKRWAPLFDRLIATLSKLHQEYERRLGSLPPQIVSIRLLESNNFFKLTGAPKWSTAVYLRGEILLPIEPSRRIDLRTLGLAIRHEYSHAVTNNLAAGRCPGWLDEGLAQWSEGEESASNQEVLRRWLSEHDPLSFSDLQRGFTDLNYELAAVAYAQSLFAVQRMISIFGFKAIGVFFDLLREGHRQEQAFKRAFSISQSEFEQHLNQALLERYPHTKI